MVLNHEKNPVGPLPLQSESLQRHLRAHHPFLRMLPTEPLADVVEKTSQKQRGPILQLLHQLGEFRHGLRIPSSPKPAQLLDKEDRMDIHGITVIEHMLPTADDMLPFRNEGR